MPVLAYLIIDKVKINVDEDGEPVNSLWIRAYTPAIKGALRSRWTEARGRGGRRSSCSW